MLLALEKILIPATQHPVSEEHSHDLCITVVFTSVAGTLAALKQAGALANSLGARMTLLVAQTVPYPLPLESPPVLLEFSEKRFRVIAAESPVETTLKIYLCRDRLDTILSVLKPGSIIVVGGRKRWWPTRDELLARSLRRAGYEAVFTETE
jgi:hypothetical protein